jgi:ABC-type nitrate/sulfonate/bicarbonate transport system substrate-binding protein
MRVGYPMLANFGDTLNIPQTILTARNEYLEKFSETSKRFLKALIQGIHFAKSNKAEALKAGFEAKLQGEPEIVYPAYDLYAAAFSGDLSVNVSGLQTMLDEDKRSNLIDNKFSLDRVISDKILKLAQQELRSEGRLK